MNSNRLTKDIAERLVALCREAKFEEAQKELYAADAVSVEADDSPAFAKETKGLQAIIEKGQKWGSMVEAMHRFEVSDPLVADDSFACTMSMDISMRGQGRRQMSEVCVYEVKDGAIASERFF